MKALLKEESNYGYEEHLAVGSTGDSHSDDHRADSETHLAVGRIPDLGEFAEDLDFSDLLREEGIFGPSSVDETSFDAAIGGLKKSQRRGLTVKQAQMSFTEDDFDDPAQRKAFILLRHYKNEIFKAKTTPDEIIEAATFIFGRSQTGELNFDLCCEVLNARRDVLRMRFHYEFFLKWMVFPVEFPFMIDPLPKVVENEILMHIGEDARALAVEAWVQPGITTDEMYAKAMQTIRTDSIGRQAPTQLQLKKWLEAMEDRYLMSRSHDNWYLTGRNPLLEKINASRFVTSGTGGNTPWSKLW